MRSPSRHRRRARPWLGTLVDITLDAADDTRAEAAFEAAFEAVALVHRLMSAHDAASDIRLLSEAAHLRPLRVHEHTLAVLRLAKAMHAQSDGIFDVAVGALMARDGQVPALARPRRGLVGSSDDIHIADDGAVAFARPLHLDLGGVAKGYAMDCAVAALRAQGIASGLANAGGDMRAFGPGEHTVQLRFAEGVRAVASLREGALASSCNAGCEGTSPHIDPRRRRSIRSLLSVIVHAPSAAVADALTKVALVCPAAADRACAAFAAEWRAFDYAGRIG
jgi:FAD:protein FMN transferase